MNFIEWICGRMLESGRIEAEELAAQIGTPPRDPEIAEADVWTSPQTGEASEVVFVPSVRLTVADLSTRYGSYEESPRLHPGSPRKLLFSPGGDGEHPYVVRIIVEVPSDAKPVDAASVERVIVSRAPSAGSRTSVGVVASQAREAATWPRLLGGPANFGVRSWQTGSLDSVRRELEQALAVQFQPSTDKADEGKPVFECQMPACRLRLNSWPSKASGLWIYNLIGEVTDDIDGPLPEVVSKGMADYLRSRGCDWYLPARAELLEEAGLLRERQLDRDTIVAILEARWLSASSDEEREAGVQLLTTIVDLWLADVRRTPDPVAQLQAKRTDFEGWGKGVAPESRINILACYAVQEQLSVLEAELFDMSEQPPTERDAPAMRARLGEMRGMLPPLRDMTNQLGVSSIVRQYERVAAAIDQLAALV